MSKKVYRQRQRYRQRNRSHSFFNDVINIKNFAPNTIKLDKRSFKRILISYIGYVTIKDLKYVKINSVNSLHLIFRKVNGYFEEIIKSNI